MAQSSGGDWKKDQEVQVYDTSKHQWITGKIYDIQEDDEEKIYCVEYDEYSLQIHEKDVHSLMRASEITEQSNERDAEEMFMNFSKQIAAKLPLSRQMQILSENARKINFQQKVTWRGVVEAVSQELYPVIASALGSSVEQLLQDRALRLTDFGEATVDEVIAALKIKKSALLNKEIDYIKELVERTVKYNDYVQSALRNKQKLNVYTKTNTTNKKDALFGYKILGDVPELDADANLNPEWEGLTANLVVDIYGIFKAMKYGIFQREQYSKTSFLRDIESAESKILKGAMVSSLIQKIDIESTVSFHPQYMIKDDLFETVNPLLAMSLVLNKLKSKQIGNGIKFKCVVVPALITSIYDETKEFESNINDISQYLREILPVNTRILNEVLRASNDVSKTAEILIEMMEYILSRSIQRTTTNPASSPMTVFVVFDRKAHAAGPTNISVHVFVVDDQPALSLSELNYSHFIGMEMTVTQNADPETITKCWLRFGKGDRLRFVPEQLLWIVPALFGRSSTMKPYDFWSRVYDDDYKHRWSVSLKDDILSKYHHILTGNILVSVNYHRDQVITPHVGDSVDGLRDHLVKTLDTMLMEKLRPLLSGQYYDSDAVVDDVMVMVMERDSVKGNESNICQQLNGPKSNGFHRLKHEVISYLKIGCAVNDKRHLSDCPFIEEMVQNLTRFEKFGMRIDASNVFEFELSSVMKGLDHLYQVHEYSLEENRQRIRQYMREHIQCHLSADCPVVQQHGNRKRENDRRRADRQKEHEQADDRQITTDEIETLCEATRDSMCSAHCYLLHSTDELYRLRLATAELRFATAVIEDGEEQKEDGTKNDDKKDQDTEPLSINYGESVMEWLSFLEPPKFGSLGEELVYNQDSTLDHSLLARMTVQCSVAIEDTDYTLKEALGLKTYADATAFQSELRKAHWQGMPLEMKRSYFHWAMTLYEAHLYHAKPIPAISSTLKNPRRIFHGLNRMFTMNQELPIYLGPFSVSTSKTVAKQFSNEKGLLFTIASSYVNPFKFSIGIDMLKFSAFKNEAEVLLNNQPIPIKKTETFGDAMMRFVNHFLFSLKNRKTRINDVAAFFHKLGIDWNDDWIPFILKHQLLFKKTRFNGRKTIDRLFSELNITDHRLVDSILDMTHVDGRPYVVHLVEDLKVAHLLQHYRLMTSTFIIRKYCKEINSSWLKWEPNNTLNQVLGVKEVDDSCFDNAVYQINGVKAGLASHFFPDAVRSVSVQHSHFFGARFTAIHGQKLDTVSTDEPVPHDFGALLKLDGYSNGCIFVDDIPSPEHSFRIGQSVVCNDGVSGVISRITTNGVSIRISDELMICFRWFERSQFPTELKLNFESQQHLAKYEFALTDNQNAEVKDLISAEKYKCSKVQIFEFLCSASLDRSDVNFPAMAVYVHLKNDEEYKWGRIALIKYPASHLSTSNMIFPENGDVSVEGFLKTLQQTYFEITNKDLFLQRYGLEHGIPSEWIPIISESPLLFDVTCYRRRLIIERLIVEINLWSTEWIHRILEQKVEDQPMLKWLVEEHRLYQLHDHYRVYTSFSVESSALLNNRWLRFSKNIKMIGKPGFGDSDDTCFNMSQYEADGNTITASTESVAMSVRQISVKNQTLFGEQAAVLHKFEENEGGHEKPNFNHFVDFFKVDQYSNGCIFVDDIPSKRHSFCEGQQVQMDDEATGTISRVTAGKFCIKIVCALDNMTSYRWILKSEAPKKIDLRFENQEDLQRFCFSSAVIEEEKPLKSSSLAKHKFSVVESIRIPCPALMDNIYRSTNVTIGIYAKPRDDGYGWVQVKNLKYPATNEPLSALNSAGFKRDSTVAAVDQLIEALIHHEAEITNAKEVLASVGVMANTESEWMSVISAHRLLFDVTAYRRKLVIERLIVELKLMSTEWIHRILEEKKNDKPMIQWLVEERKMNRLYDHYRVFTSRFDESYSALLNCRWLRIRTSSKMNMEYGFGYRNKDCFQETEYRADGEVIDSTTSVVSGTVSRITVTNRDLFGEQAAVLQEFEKKGDDNYVANDFADALRFDEEFVFLNHIPAASYVFDVGQEVQCNDKRIGRICRITSDKICVKVHEDEYLMASYRWYERSDVPMQLTLKFRYKNYLSNLIFVVTAGQKDDDYISSRERENHHFRDIENFGITKFKIISFGLILR